VVKQTQSTQHQVKPCAHQHAAAGYKKHSQYRDNFAGKPQKKKDLGKDASRKLRTSRLKTKEKR